MPFQATSIIPERAYDSAKQIASRTRQDCVNSIVEFQSVTASDRIIALHSRLKDARDSLSSLSQTPGLVAYAQAQEAGQPGYDPAAEFTTMLATIDAVLTHIETAIPKDGNGYILDRQFVNNTFTYRTFTAANLSTLRGLLQNIVDQIA